MAEKLLKGVTDNSRLAHSKVQAGWALIAAFCSMGTSHVRPNSARLQLLWRAAFPRSVEEARGEGGRGDAFTWQCTVDARAGALAAMEALVVHGPELVADGELMRRSIVAPVEATLQTLAVVHGGGRSPQLRSAVHTLRLRLYSLLTRLPVDSFAHCLSALLRELVADITLADNSQWTVTASEPAQQCGALNECLLGGWLMSANSAELELQVWQPPSLR